MRGAIYDTERDSLVLYIRVSLYILLFCCPCQIKRRTPHSNAQWKMKVIVKQKNQS